MPVLIVIERRSKAERPASVAVRKFHHLGDVTYRLSKLRQTRSGSARQGESSTDISLIMCFTVAGSAP